MLNMRKTFVNLRATRRRWERLMDVGRAAVPPLSPESVAVHLQETLDFGSNPGALRMFTYVPPELPKNPALVVVLHGCMQSAAAYDLGAGWSTLAERYGFALLLPEQQRCNNPNGCFNWFQPGDIERGHGEALSIRQMVDKVATDYGIDKRRIFATGLSAGGAMTSVMLATYPDVFAGGAIVAGLPYGAATNAQQAFKSMFQSPSRPAREWGDLVREASPHTGPWPRVSVWHGGADTTVIPANAIEIVKQWTDVHGLPQAPTRTETVDGYPRQVWCDAAGEALIESYLIPGMAHGTPLAAGSAEGHYGAAGAFLLDVGISSSFHIAKFWGLTDHAPAVIRTGGRQAVPSIEDLHVFAKREKSEAPIDKTEPADEGRSPAVDIRAIITNALKAAGLMKAN